MRAARSARRQMLLWFCTGVFAIQIEASQRRRVGKPEDRCDTQTCNHITNPNRTFPSYDVFRPLNSRSVLPGVAIFDQNGAKLDPSFSSMNKSGRLKYFGHTIRFKKKLRFCRKIRSTHTTCAASRWGWRQHGAIQMWLPSADVYGRMRSFLTHA